MKPIDISIPGSKSITNRALILAALSKGVSILKNAAICDDSTYMIKGLKKLGIKIHQKGSTVKIIGTGGKFKKHIKPIKIFTGNAGTTTRFLTALASLTNNEIIIDGDARMRERPIKELATALNKLGAKIKITGDCPPLHIYPSKLHGGKISLPGNISSQYLSAILLISPFIREKTTINIEQKLYSRPYIDMTVQIAKYFGIKIINKNFRKFKIQEAHLRTQSKTISIESDASSASYFGAYAALHPRKSILLQNIHKNSLQGDIKFLKYLKKMGCKIIEQKNGTLIKGTRKLKSMGTIDMNETPDLVMTFAIISLFAQGKTKITNIANLKIKESDRIQALKNEIKKLINSLNLEKHIKINTGLDWLTIFVRNNRLEFTHVSERENKKTTSQDAKIYKSHIVIQTYNDHRMAMSFGILTDIFRNLTIQNPSCVSKSYTTFWKELKKCHKKKTIISAKRTLNIVLTGLRGSGKSKIGKLIAKKLKLNFVDIDDEIEKHEKMKIKKLAELRGWKYFRAVESLIAKKVGKLKNTVISTGGGTIIDRDNEKALKKNGKIIYLHEKPEICAQRIASSKNRPPLTNKETVEEEIKYLYKQRNGRYCESANLIFQRTGNLEKDAEKIIKKLNLSS